MIMLNEIKQCTTTLKLLEEDTVDGNYVDGLRKTQWMEIILPINPLTPEDFHVFE